MNITSLHTNILEASAASVKWCRVGRTRYVGCTAAHPLFAASFNKDYSFSKNFMSITSLHTHILEASAAPEDNDFVWTYANRVAAFDRAFT